MFGWFNTNDFVLTLELEYKLYYLLSARSVSQAPLLGDKGKDKKISDNSIYTKLIMTIYKQYKKPYHENHSQILTISLF